MKVCITGLDVGPPWNEGVKKNIINTATKLKERGIDVFIVTMARNPVKSFEGVPIYSIKLPKFVKEIELFQYLFSVPVFILKARKIIRKEKPDIIHGHYPVLSAGFIDIIIKNKKIKIVETMSGNTYDASLKDLKNMSFSTFIYEQLLHLLLNNRIITRIVSNRFEHVIAMNRHSSSSIKKAAKIIPNGVNIDKYKFKKKKIKKITNILYLGHFNYAKGVEFLIRAFAGVAKANKNIQLTIAWSGGGTTDKKITDLIEKYNIKDKIRFLGVVDVSKIMIESDIFVLPRTTAFGTVTFPNVLLESMACGTPVITSNVGGVDEFIINDKTGLLVPPKDVKSLEEAIISLINNKDKRERIAINARKAVEEKYSWEKIADSIIKVYEDVSDERR
ncbi:MAG: glycosyltransferase [Nanohaloarchaea archaeon]|nr:glycosyltransferase [Candidatus Nanohaloarchaea archaeon]